MRGRPVQPGEILLADYIKRLGITYGLQPLAPEGPGWPTEGHHILTSSIMSRGSKRRANAKIIAGSGLDKKTLSEADICEKFITPAIQQARWNTVEQIYREYTLRPGLVVVRGNQSQHNAPYGDF